MLSVDFAEFMKNIIRQKVQLSIQNFALIRKLILQIMICELKLNLVPVILPVCLLIVSYLYI